MLKAGMTKSEIEKELEGKGPFIKIDYLNRFLKEPLTMDMKRFVFLKLEEIYEKLGMLRDAARMYNNAAGISITFADKIKFFLKETEMYISAGEYSKADEAMRKAMGEANTIEKQRIYNQVIEMYKKKAEKYEKENKRVKAADTYEKLLDMNISPFEREEFIKKLVSLYEKLGRIKELNDLKRRFKKI